MTWNYRVVRTTDGEEESFAIYEVYYDDDGRPEARTEEPTHPAGETLEELAEDLQAYQAALSQPVLDDTWFQQATDERITTEEVLVDLASTDRVHRYQAEIDTILAALGHPEALVTDLTIVRDFLGPVEADDVWLRDLRRALGVPVEADDFLVDIAERLRERPENAS